MSMPKMWIYENPNEIRLAIMQSVLGDKEFIHLVFEKKGVQ